MIKVYRQTDRIELKINDVTFRVKPLSYAEKSTISAKIRNKEGLQTEDVLESVRLIIKYSIKDVKGIGYIDDTEMSLDFEDNGDLKDSFVDELMSMEITNDLNTALFAFLQGIPEEIVDPTTGEVLPNIKITPISGQPSKKK